ncbi:MAG: NAD(P)/FAD-dependent oxidoreductase [Chloroflexaceae bacterium]|nr:NAD(P)/FAD-dependent oxidoreductase [Chloroflexaceae bacterium]
MTAAYDAIVVGSGPNGLAAAITLAEQGRAVLVLEARPIPGGAVATEELTLPGFLHDTFSAVYPAAVASPVFSRMPLERFGLRWAHPPIAMAHPLPNGKAAALYRDVERTVDNLERLAPGDGRRWREFIAPYLKHYRAMRDILLGSFPPIGGAVRLLAGRGLDGSLEFARLVLLSATALTSELFESAGAAAWLYGSSLHADVPLDGAGSAIGGVYLLLLGHAVGWPSPAGGAGNLARALVRYLESMGGQVRVNTPVVRVLVERGRVAGVATAQGERFTAPVVIGDVTPRGLLHLAGDALPTRYAAQLRRYRYGEPSFKIDWALAGPVPWEAAEARQAGTLHLGGPANELLHSHYMQRAEQMPDYPFMLVGQQSLADPVRAPAGQHTLWGYTHPPRSTNYATDHERIIERMENHIERYAPGFRKLILARHTLAPADLERSNQNLIGGDVGGGSYAFDQLVFRPVVSLLPYRTPIAGLYIGSAATFPGAAVHGIGGGAAARLALLEGRVRRWW